jgi:NADPH-dependent 2,4-dienoyl-CoA reductase/sulfur reductase-like enzyme
MRRIVIAGGSSAGLAAARTLREEGFDGELTIVEPEAHPPYDRTALSKDLVTGRAQVDDIALLEPERLSSLDIRWHRGQRAVGLAPFSRQVILANGNALPYDGAVLATGSSPRELDFGTRAPRGVYTLRGLDDALALRAALAGSQHVVLVGGGFIGLELAVAAGHYGARVTILEAGEATLAGPLGPVVGAAIGARHTRRGVAILTRVEVVGWAGGDELSGVALADGRVIRADLAVVGVGAQPNSAWLTGSGAGDKRGALCDATLATPLPGVVAAGDVVRYPHPLVRQNVRIEHFEHAELSGAHAARRLLRGADAGPYESLPSVWSHQGDHTIQVAGFPSGTAEIEIVEGDLDNGPFATVYRDQGQTVAALTLDLPRTYRRLRRELSLQGSAV